MAKSILRPEYLRHSILVFYAEYPPSHGGQLPSMRECAKALHYASASNMQPVIMGLVQEGYLEAVWNEAQTSLLPRTTRITDKGRTALNQEPERG